MNQTNKTNDESLRLMLLFVAVLLVSSLVAGSVLGELRRIMTVLAWSQIYPAVIAVEHVPWFLSLPAIGSVVFAPAIAMHEVLSHIGAGSVDGVLWSDVQLIAGRVAACLYGPLLLTMAMGFWKRRPDMRFRSRRSLANLARALGDVFKTSKVTAQAGRISANGEETRNFGRDFAERVRACQKGSTGSALLRAQPEPVTPSTWENSLRPEDWLLCQGLSVRHADVARLEQGRFADAPSSKMRDAWKNVSVEPVSEAMVSQLGKPWRGFDALRSRESALAAAFALNFGFRQSDANALLDGLGELAYASSCSGAKLDKAIAGNRKLGRLIGFALAADFGQELERLAARHAWENTAFITMLRRARVDRGVVATASFLWLKSTNRQLWYCLNSVAGNVAFVEASGALAHHRAEIQAGVPLFRPTTIQAAKSLVEEYLGPAIEIDAKEDAKRLPWQQEQKGQPPRVELSQLPVSAAADQYKEREVRA